MTAGVLILNPDTIAMATDSAATINNEKITFGNKKLFMLSNNPPMGIMFYGSSKFSDVSVAILINEFIEQTNFEKIKDIESIKEELIKHIEETTDDSDIDFYLEEFKETLLKELEKIPYNRMNQFIKYIEAEEIFSFLENKEFNEKFEKIKQEEDLISNIDFLKKYFVNFLKKQKTGFVIAGFDNHNHFASYSLFDIYLKYNNEIYIGNEETKINYNETKIIPIAQTDVMDTFLRGINEDIENTMVILFEKILDEYHDQIIEIILNNNKEISKPQLEFQLKQLNKFTMSKIVNKILNLEKNSQDIIANSLYSFPPYDLGQLARILVENTAMKRKFSPNLETVGGNINTAIISKVDGFIWMDNECPYDIEKNPQFLEREKTKY